MPIQRSFIDELMTRVDIVDVIDSYVSLRKIGHNFKACCPFHQEKTPSFVVFAEGQHYHCFGCGVHGTAIGFLMDFAHLSYVEAIHELAAKMGMSVVYEEGYSQATAISDREELYQIMKQATEFYWKQWQQPAAVVAKTYLKQRGLTGQTAKEFGIGYAPAGWDNLLKNLAMSQDQQELMLKAGLIKKSETGRYYDHFRDRIMFPIHDRRGRVIAFGGRLLTDKENEPKYLNSPETPLFQKGNELYGWYFARKVRPLEKVIVVEGYMDVVMLAQHGIHNVVATLGTATTREHLTRLFREALDIIFCFDGDAAGQKAAWRALENGMSLLQEGRQLSFMFLPPGEDPDSFVRKHGTTGFHHYLAESQPLSKFLFDTLTQSLKLDTPEGQARLVELAKPLLTKLPKGAYRDSMLQKLSELTQVESSKLTTLIPSHQPVLAQKNQSPPNIRTPLSLIQKAIVHLLHKPALAQKVEYPNTKLSQLANQPNMLLLLNLIEFIRNRPHVTLAGICEHWRNTEYENTLNWLSQHTFQQTLAMVTQLDEEFVDAIKQFYREADKQRYELLTQKRPLTEEERQELQNLLRVS